MLADRRRQVLDSSVNLAVKFARVHLLREAENIAVLEFFLAARAVQLHFLGCCEVNEESLDNLLGDFIARRRCH
jgi:hypothetical protein